MTTDRYYDDVLASLVKRVNYMDRRLVVSETVDNSALTHSVLLGLDADDHTQYHNDARGDARYYTQARLQASGSASVHWDNLTNIDSGDITHNSLAGLTTGDPHTQYFLLNGRGGGQLVYAGTGAADSYSFFATSANSGGGAGIAFDFWTGTDPGDAHLLEMLHNGNARFFNPVGFNVAASSDAQVSITSASASQRGLLIDAAASPTVPALHVRDSSGNDVVEVTPQSATFARYTTDQSTAQVVYRNQAAAGTANAMRLALAMQTTTNNRFVGEMRAQLSDTTDASRTSYLAWWTADNGTYAEQMRLAGDSGLSLASGDVTVSSGKITASGNIGAGVTSPLGRVHSRANSSNHMWYNIGPLTSGTTTIIPNGTGDVVRGLYAFAVSSPGAGTIDDYTGLITPSSSAAIFSDGSNALTLAVAADGAVTIYRSTGSGTWYAALFLMWI